MLQPSSVHNASPVLCTQGHEAHSTLAMHSKVPRRGHAHPHTHTHPCHPLLLPSHTVAPQEDICERTQRHDCRGNPGKSGCAVHTRQVRQGTLGRVYMHIPANGKITSVGYGAKKHSAQVSWHANCDQPFCQHPSEGCGNDQATHTAHGERICLWGRRKQTATQSTQICVAQHSCPHKVQASNLANPHQAHTRLLLHDHQLLVCLIMQPGKHSKQDAVNHPTASSLASTTATPHRPF